MDQILLDFDRITDVSILEHRNFCKAAPVPLVVTPDLDLLPISLLDRLFDSRAQSSKHFITNRSIVGAEFRKKLQAMRAIAFKNNVKGPVEFLGTKLRY